MIAPLPKYTTLRPDVIDAREKLFDCIKSDDAAGIRDVYNKYKGIFVTPIQILDDLHKPVGQTCFINIRDDFSLTPLQEAAITGKAEAVKALLELPDTGIDVNARTPKAYDIKDGNQIQVGDRTAFQLAQKQGHKAVAVVLKNDPRVDCESYRNGTHVIKSDIRIANGVRKRFEAEGMDLTGMLARENRTHVKDHQQEEMASHPLKFKRNRQNTKSRALTAPTTGRS